MKIRLQTADGGLVHETIIPPFNEPPKSISWGVRVFVFHEMIPSEHEDSEAWQVYREGFHYALTDNPNS